MAVQIQMRRDLAAAWTATNPTPASGELCLETDTRLTKMGDGVTPWNSLPYWPTASGSESRIFYDTAVGGIENYPETAGHFNSVNASTAPRLVANWAQFANCFFLVENFTTHVKTVHSFPTLNDFITWKNANIPHGGVPDQFTERIHLRPFDIVDNEIPVVDRLYGMNNLYNSWHGGKMKAWPNHLGQGETGQAVLNAIWAHFWPALAGNFAAADFLKNANGRKSCWTSRNWTQLYSMPRRGEIVNISGTTPGVTNRHSANETWAGFNPLTPGDNFLRIDDICYVYVDESLGSWQISQYAQQGGGKIARRWLLEGGGANSGFAAFKLVADTVPGSRQIAVLIKPMGIDRIWLPFFDNTLYAMEVVRNINADQQPTHFKQIPWGDFNAGGGSSPHPNSGMYLKKGSWLSGTSRFNVNLRQVKGSNRERIHFRLRDLTTGKVSPVSQAHIRLRIDDVNAPVKLIVSRG